MCVHDFICVWGTDNPRIFYLIESSLLVDVKNTMSWISCQSPMLSNTYWSVGGWDTTKDGTDLIKIASYYKFYYHTLMAVQRDVSICDLEHSTVRCHLKSKTGSDDTWGNFYTLPSTSSVVNDLIMPSATITSSCCISLSQGRKLREAQRIGGFVRTILAIAALPFCKKSGLSCPSCVCPTVLKFAWQKSSATWKAITKHYPPISSWVSPSSSMNLAFYAYNCWPTTDLFPAQWESRFKHTIAMWKPYGLMEITLLSSSG